ncbi:hypothetical protein DER45DRAFT_544294 [Fusarium avenaceum]|nr:hypothetical protein DER45DRAFT_544294 [Fusarium avenaceum]
MAFKEYQGPNYLNNTFTSNLRLNNYNTKAAKDAEELAACKAEIIALKAQLSEAQNIANTSKTQSTEARSTTRSNDLAVPKPRQRMSKEQLQSQLNQRKTERDHNWSEVNNRTPERDCNWSELQKRTSELDNGDVTICQIVWEGRDLTDDSNVAWKVKERVRTSWSVPSSNDISNCDPQPGSRKSGEVELCRSRNVEGWVYEEIPSFP